MSEEEIHKALEIIGQPITVNHKEYHYFDQENYDKLVAVYNNCLWFIRNFEQINTTVERVQQENKQLKEKIDKYEVAFEKLKNTQDYKEIFEMSGVVQERDKYKEVIEEVREYINKWNLVPCGAVKNRQAILEILDKCKENKE